MLILFDCDGVLVDSEVIASEVTNKLVKELGLELSIEEFASRFAGLNGETIFATVAEELQITHPEDIVERCDVQIDEVQAQSLLEVTGVHAMLDMLDDPRCICSNSTTDRLERNLKKTKLYDRFRPHVFSSLEVRDGQPKPSPDVFLHAAEEFKTDPKDCIIIEDSSHGVQGGVAAGMRVIGFVGASHSYPGHAEQLMDAGAETTINKLLDIPATIEAFKNWSSNGL
ncbi:MAG: HAD family hydrolase [Hyphomicrobiales bacterium]|nr:HAD-IA family hydrolase [Hyphomicrobiales bacterium]PCJ88804.1 MAG: HAD family hydrolase [Hyphomicrobiales bacterium]